MVRIPADQREEKLLAAAREVFLEKGYSDTSLADIVAISGGSRRNIYDAFDGKQGLFRAALESVLTPKLDRLPFREDAKADPEAALADIAFRLLREILDPTHIGAFRLILAEAARDPGVAEIMQQTGSKAATARIATFLSDYLHISENMTAARLFVGLTIADYQVQAFVHPDFALGDDELRAHSEIVARVFLHGIASQKISN